MTDNNYKKAIKKLKVTDNYNKRINQAFLELTKVVSEDSEGFFGDQVSRQRGIRKWWDKWVVQVSTHQSVLDEKYLDSEFKDVIKSKLAQNCVEEVAEDCINYLTEQRKIEATFLAIRRGDNAKTN